MPSLQKKYKIFAACWYDWGWEQELLVERGRILWG